MERTTGRRALSKMTGDRRNSDTQYVRRLLIAVAIVSATLLLWQLRTVFLLLFGAALVATIIRSIAEPVRAHLRFPERLAVLLSILSLFGIVGLLSWLIRSKVADQASALAETLPRSAQLVDGSFERLGFGHPITNWLARLHSGSGFEGSNLAGFAASMSLIVASSLIVLFSGIFLASEPRLYRSGLIKLIPPSRRGVVAEAMQDSERALRLWLRGQLCAMILIGIMTWLGLWLLGVQSPLALALISGTLEFVPYAGAITSAIPAILVAMVQSPQLAVWVVLLYVLVHHVEAYLLQPIIQQFAVEIPPVITLFGILAFGVLFGIVGVLLAAPLAVVSYVLVKRLYVIETLDTETPIPGDTG